jgi:NAD(P)-dependent dehydrogenase (short-subunit alcohol dehydrogenase family)
VKLTASELFALEGKTVLLTGATGFLGRAMAQVLLANGARLIALGRSERLANLVTEWGDTYGRNKVSGHRIDMYDSDALAATLDRIVRDEFVEVLINNAHELGPRSGFNSKSGSLENASLDQWMRNMAGGIYWPAMTVQKLGPAMQAAGRGSIINIATMYAVVAPNPLLYHGTDFLNPPGYSVAKAGLLALTRYIASFWGPSGIRANAILPGPFSNTEDITGNSVKQGDPFLERLKERTCLRRLGKPQELLGPVLFLASDASAFMTGHALTVDGGWTII